LISIFVSYIVQHVSILTKPFSGTLHLQY